MAGGYVTKPGIVRSGSVVPEPGPLRSDGWLFGANDLRRGRGRTGRRNLYQRHSSISTGRSKLLRMQPNLLVRHFADEHEKERVVTALPVGVRPGSTGQYLPERLRGERFRDGSRGLRCADLLMDDQFVGPVGTVFRHRRGLEKDLRLMRADTVSGRSSAVIQRGD